MSQRNDRATCGNPLRILRLLAGTCLLAGLCTLDAGAREGLTESIEQVLQQAERAVENQELELAESLYRDALRDGWLLKSSLETAAGATEAARDALQEATRSAVTTGRQIPVAAVADLSQAEQAELRGLLTATLAEVYRNLGALCEESRRPQQAAAHFAAADALALPEGGSAERPGSGSLDLGQPPSAPDLDEEQLAAAIAAVGAATLVDDKIAAQEVGRLHQQLARLHLARGHEELAVAELRTAAELGGLDVDLGLKLADLEVAAGDAAAARRILQMLTTAHPSPRALVKLAELTWPTGPPRSLPILLQALALAPNSEEILGHTANAYLAADEPEKALEILVPLMTLSPGVVAYLRLLGEAYTKLGRLEEATATLREAVALEPSYLRSRIHLAGVLLHRQRFDEAETELHEILAIDPERPEAKDLLEFLETARSAQQPAQQ
jgi:tetratricopeptide (TPR) repeat protein